MGLLPVEVRGQGCAGEWACVHGPCPVRAVRLRVRAAKARHLPRLRCPLCLRTLEFRRWLPHPVGVPPSGGLEPKTA
jgi:hypothetical protein